MTRAVCPSCGAPIRLSPLVGLVADHGRCSVGTGADAILLLDLDATQLGGPVITRSLARSEVIELTAAGASDDDVARAVMEVERVSPSLVRRRVVGIDVEALLGTPGRVSP